MERARHDAETGDFLRVLLQKFVRRLRGPTRPHKLSEPEIGRRAGVSQALINKITKSSQRREHARSTYDKLATAFPGEWHNFLRDLPAEERARLRAAFAWALGPEERASGDPLLDEAIQTLTRLFHRASRPEKSMVIDWLTLKAEQIRETSNSLERGKVGRDRYAQRQA